MNKLLLTLLLLSSNLLASTLNLDFELLTDSKPTSWVPTGTPGKYVQKIVSDELQNGKHSALIAAQDNQKINRNWINVIDKQFLGKSITLSGFVKTDKITAGKSGLFIMIQPNGPYNFMEETPVNGTTNWKEYSISLPLPKSAYDKIIIGGYLTGNGKAWFDNFSISIDSKPIELAKLVPLKSAKLDKEFISGSKITNKQLRMASVDQLALLGKVWGFLKYHHPAIASGNLNWDFELFRFLPKYLAVSKPKEYEPLLFKWIADLGELPTCPNCKNSNSTSKLKPDHSWFDEISSSKLRNKLQTVYLNRHQGEHYYIAANASGIPSFTNEDSYSDMPYPDAGFRLLSLYRYWNIVSYYFPYKYLTDKNWNSVLDEYLHIVSNAENELEYEIAIEQLLTEIHDSHGGIYKGKNAIQNHLSQTLPYSISFIDNQPVIEKIIQTKVKNYTHRLQVGDQILAIDDIDIHEIMNKKLSKIVGSKLSSKQRMLSHRLFLGPTTINTVVVMRNKTKLVLDVESISTGDLDYEGFFAPSSKKAFEIIEHNLGLIRIDKIMTSEVAEAMSQLENTEAIIIDLRKYPVDSAQNEIVKYLITEPTSFFSVSVPNMSNPGEFKLEKGSDIEPNKKHYKKPIYVLINEHSMSQPEFAAMKFKVGVNTMLFGRATDGTDGDVRSFNLPGGISTGFSSIGIYHPNGAETQRVGIIPDIEVQRTINDIISGRDEILEATIQYHKQRNL